MILVLLAIAILLILYIIGVYNNLVRLRNLVRNGVAQIDNQLKRRFDLIPNLVDCVKMYMEHEKSVLENITAIRENFKNMSSLYEKGEALKEFNTSIKNLMVSVEAYPELKSNQNFLNLQEELRSTEDKVAYARQFYNDAVTRYNNKMLVFPSNLIAGMFGFEKEKYFEINDEEKQNVKIEM